MVQNIAKVLYTTCLQSHPRQNFLTLWKLQLEATHHSHQHELQWSDQRRCMPEACRQRIQLAKDFDHMLENGFPRLTDKHPDPPEYTIYISLTPNIAALNQ
ncbi:hypothetical protein DSO57_1007519 [Entomophthora muscae]|uniref:Uncharacterized protein n=1 Tax=Entomophthora muscae TaxID=34485 RepID=A0ACC2UHJ2_9FUNG|nr:hypothetical protein DSO57_1007519 [Entomophthora muscae]